MDGTKSVLPRRTGLFNPFRVGLPDAPLAVGWRPRLFVLNHFMVHPVNPVARFTGKQPLRGRYGSEWKAII